MKPVKWRVGGRLAAIAALVLATLVAAPGKAFAGDGPFAWTESSQCTPVISGRAGGGFGYAHMDYDSHRDSTTKYVLEYGHSSAYGFQQCASGIAVSPYRTTITQFYQFSGQSLSCSWSISISYPAGAGVTFGCSQSGSTVLVTATTTCANYSSSCNLDHGRVTVLAQSGASFFNYVWGWTRVTVSDPNNNTYYWETDPV